MKIAMISKSLMGEMGGKDETQQIQLERKHSVFKFALGLLTGF